MIYRVIDLLRDNGRWALFGLALGALAIGLAAVVLAATLHLDACHLCIFQRLIFFVIGGVLLIGVAAWAHVLARKAALVLGAACSIWGMVVAAQQSWLQWYPQSGFSCNLAEVSFTERFIDWLGGVFPAFFMAIGDCGSKDLVVLGLSLANWSFLVLLALFLGCTVLLFNRSTEGR